MKITRTASIAAVGILATVLLAGCTVETASAKAPTATKTPDANCKLVTSDAKSGHDKDASITDKIAGATTDLAAFGFEPDCIASTTGVSVTIPDDLRTEIGAAASEGLPLDGFNITPYELTGSKLCAVTVDFDYSKQGLLEKGFTAEVTTPPMTEEEVWAELLAEYKLDPEETAKKVTDKLGTSFMDGEYGKTVRVNPASVLTEFETWSKETTTYVTDQVAWRAGAREIQYDRAMALRIAVTGAAYLDSEGAPLLEKNDEGEEIPVVADNELTLDVLDTADPSAGMYLSTRLTELVVVTDCAADIDDEDASSPLLLPIMGENPDGPAPFRTFAQVDVAVTTDGQVSVTGTVDGYERDKDGEWITAS